MSETAMGFLFLTAAASAAPHALHAFRAFARWLARRLKPLENRPRLFRAARLAALFVASLVIPTHPVLLAFEGYSHLARQAENIAQRAVQPVELVCDAKNAAFASYSDAKLSAGFAPLIPV